MLGGQFEAKYGYKSDTSNKENETKLLAMNTQTLSNAGTALGTKALGNEGEVLGEMKPPVSLVKRDLTDWSNIIS